MLSVASLLNPAPPGPSAHRLPPSPAPSASPAASFTEESSFFGRAMMPKHKMAKDAAVFTKGKPKGVVNFRPFERLDENSSRAVREYQVFPLGKIQEYCRHIPYNSGKKDFFEKTGRESFEVFQYVFKVPGEDGEYAVMWDYNIGLVRMTPFFKCCKYSKTTPAKMLNMNPGLKEITHSITGGAIMAQGYWMPYQCAKAVCATFCHHIAGALVPIFGPDFPSQCVPPTAPEHGRMIIDPAIVMQSTREAEHFRRIYTNLVTSADSTSPKRDRKIFRGIYDDDGGRHHPRQRVRRPFISCGSPYGTDTDGEISPENDRGTSGRLPYARIPPTGPHRIASSWTPVNMPTHDYDAPAPSPWLSAVPRLTGTQSYHYGPPPPPAAHAPSHAHLAHRPHHHHHHHHHHSHHAPMYVPPPPRQHWRGKRSADHIDSDNEYDAGESRTATRSSTAATSPLEEAPAVEPALGSEKNAALLLMNLSVRDPGARRDRKEGFTTSETSSPSDQIFPRVKRPRASSM